MTSNIGADKFKNSREVGFMNSTDSPHSKLLNGYFKPEFINRIDEIILFSSLDADSLVRIAKNKISELSQRISSHGIEIELCDGVLEVLAETAKKEGTGARPIGRLIIDKIESKIAKMMLDGSLMRGDTVSVMLSCGKIECAKKILAIASSKE